MSNPFTGLDVLIVGNSIHEMIATTACIRHTKNPNIECLFIKNFEMIAMNTLNMPLNAGVGIIYSKTNNNSSLSNDQNAIDFINKIHAYGNQILFVVSVNQAENWENIFIKSGIKKNELTIRPTNKFKSCCELIQNTIGVSSDTHTKVLLEDGHKNEIKKSSYYSMIFNRCLKSNLQDPTRPPYIVKHLSHNTQPDNVMLSWMKKGIELDEALDEALPLILNSRRQKNIVWWGVDDHEFKKYKLTHEIFEYDGSLGPHEETTVFENVFHRNPHNSIVILRNTTRVINEKEELGTIIETNLKDINFLKILNNGGPGRFFENFHKVFILKDYSYDSIKIILKAFSVEIND